MTKKSDYWLIKSKTTTTSKISFKKPVTEDEAANMFFGVDDGDFDVLDEEHVLEEYISAKPIGFNTYM
jgi:hypothetical protein